MADDDPLARLRRPGGTEGGLGLFLLGFALAAAGGYLLLQNTRVSGGYAGPFGLGQASFGYALLPLGVGVALLFYDGRHWAGWLLTIAASVFIVAGVITSINIYFQGTSLFALVVMLVLLFGGLGLIFRSLRAVS